tara:strand:+ start:390 stop:902 length:513 start_codon:yes stop_codon:yes gene_type:complete
MRERIGRKKKNIEKNINIIKNANTSSSLTLPFLFIKYVVEHKTHVYQREKHIGTILKKFDWYPKLLYLDDKNRFFVYSNVGVPVTIENKPYDLEKQFNKILEDMKSVNVKHNDIKHGEILIDKDNKIYLCDFGWGSINNEFGCGIGLWNKKEKPGGSLDDATALERLNLI